MDEAETSPEISASELSVRFAAESVPVSFKPLSAVSTTSPSAARLLTSREASVLLTRVKAFAEPVTTPISFAVEPRTRSLEELARVNFEALTAAPSDCAKSRSANFKPAAASRSASVPPVWVTLTPESSSTLILPPDWVMAASIILADTVPSSTSREPATMPSSPVTAMVASALSNALIALSAASMDEAETAPEISAPSESVSFAAFTEPPVCVSLPAMLTS